MQSFSILISLYYKEKVDCLRQSLDSIFNQSLKADEVILVEDGPLTDELDKVVEEYVSKFSEIKVVKLPENRGLGSALNEGMKYCSHELVARMDTDDIAVYDRFEKQLSVFVKYPHVDVVGSWIDEFEREAGNVISTRKLPEYHYEILQYAKKRCPVNHPTVMFKKTSVLFAGGYRSLPLFEDYYLWVRLLMNGAKFYNIQESLLLFRTSPDMYKRRGGLKHALTEIRFQNHIRKLGFLTLSEFIRNIFIRFTVRVVPNFMRVFVYRKFLRR